VTGRGRLGPIDADRPSDTRGWAVPDDAGPVGDERRDRDGRRRRGHRRHRDPDGDHALHACHGRLHDHRRQARRAAGPQARVHDRLRDLRRGLGHDRDRAFVGRPARRVVVSGGHRRRADPPGDRRAGRRQLWPDGAAPRLRPGDGGRRRGRRRRPGHRRAVHHVLELALRVRRRGADRAGHPRAGAADGRRAPGRAPKDRRPRRRAVGRRPRPRGVWRPALGRLGMGVAQAGRAGALRRLRDVVAYPRRPRRALAVSHVGVRA
jgi:hypothetical protein